AFGPDERIEGDYPSTDYGVFLTASEPRFEGGQLSVEVEVDAHALPRFVREHPPSPSQPTGARLDLDISDDLDPYAVDGGVHVRLPASVTVHLPIRVALSGGLIEPTPSADASHASLFAASSLDLHSGVDDAVSYD